jgi:hypothetical protein
MYNVSRLEHLIGIPWGQGPPPQSADCFSLAVYAQEQLWGRKINVPALGDPSWDDDTLKAKSHEMKDALSKFAYQVDEQDEGDLCLIELGECIHLATLIDKWHILHLLIDRKSRISKLSGWPVKNFWRVGGVA